MRSAKLRDVCKFKPSKRLARASLSGTDAVSFVPMNDLGIHQKYIGRNEQRLLSEVIGSYTYFAEGDVLLAKITPCFENGKLGVARALTNGVGFGSSEFTVIRPSDQVLAEYLYYFLDRDEVRLKGAKVMTGAVGHKRVPQEFVEALEIPLPPLEEQRRIVAVLDEAFAAIATATANAENNLANAQQLFDSFADCLFSSNTTEWEDGLLGGICDLFQGLAINKGSKHLIVSEGLPLLRIKDLRSGSHEMCVAPTGFPKNALVTPNDIVYTRTGQIGLVFRGRRGVIHNNCFKVVPSEKMDASFLFWWLQRPTFKKKVVELASRAAQPDITHSLFKSLPISIPPMSEQKDIVRRIEDLRGRTEQMKASYIHNIALLDQIKQSILRAAFGGTLGTTAAEALEPA